MILSKKFGQNELFLVNFGTYYHGLIIVDLLPKLRRIRMKILIFNIV